MPAKAYELGFADYIRIVRKRWKISVLTTLTGLFMASVWSRSLPHLYEASAQVKVKPPPQAEVIAEEGGGGIKTMRGPTVAEVARLLQGGTFAERVARRLAADEILPGEAPPANAEKVARVAGRLPGMVSVVERPQKFSALGIVEVIARSEIPEEAAEIANAYAAEAAAYTLESLNARREELRRYLTFRLAQAESSVQVSNEALQGLTEIQARRDETARLLADVEAERKRLAEEAKDREDVRRRVESPEAAAEIRSSDPTVQALVKRIGELVERRATVLDRYTPTHPEVASTAAELRRLMPRLAAAVDESFERADRRWREVLAEESELRTRLAEIEADLRNRENPYILQQRAALRLNQFGAIAQRLEEERFQDLLEEGRVEVAGTAVVPREPSSPPYRLHVTAGGTIGLLVGLALVFVLETLDTSIGTIEDVEAYLGLPVLGVIPFIRPAAPAAEPATDEKGRLVETPPIGPMLVAQHLPNSIPAEAFRALRTHLLSALGGTAHKVFLLTSSGPQEGKSTTTGNLATTLARMGSRTVLVEANMRRPTAHKTFSTTRAPGLSEVLLGANWREIVREVPGIPGLSLLTAGSPPSTNPAELLSQSALQRLFDEMKAEYDYVLVDAPPTLPVADPMLIAPKVDGVLIVYYVGKAAREAILRAKTHLEHVGGRPIGIILNHIRPEAQAGYYYYYYHYRYYGA